MSTQSLLGTVQKEVLEVACFLQSRKLIKYCLKDVLNITLTPSFPGAPEKSLEFRIFFHRIPQRIVRIYA